MDIDFYFMLQALLAALTAVPRSLGIAFSAVGIGITLGLPIALCRFYRIQGIAPLFAFLITVIKGLPIILLFFVFYVIMAQRPGMSVNLVAITAISVASTARMSEIFRGALEAVDKSQFDAAASVGHSAQAAFFRIVLPQIIPVVLPMSSGEIIKAIKAVPIAMLIGVTDILNTAISEAVINYRYLEAYLAAALVFWAVFIIVEQIFLIIERYFQKKMQKVLV